MLTSDQEAQVRFASRVWSTGDTSGAPASTVKAADKLIFLVAINGAPASLKEFNSVASEIIKLSN